MFALCAWMTSSCSRGAACVLMSCDLARSKGIWRALTSTILVPCRTRATCTSPYWLGTSSPVTVLVPAGPVGTVVVAMVVVVVVAAGPALVVVSEAGGAPLAGGCPLVSGGAVEAVAGGVVVFALAFTRGTGDDLNVSTSHRPTTVSPMVAKARRITTSSGLDS